MQACRQRQTLTIHARDALHVGVVPGDKDASCRGRAGGQIGAATLPACQASVLKTDRLPTRTGAVQAEEIAARQGGFPLLMPQACQMCKCKGSSSCAWTAAGNSGTSTCMFACSTHQLCPPLTKSSQHVRNGLAEVFVLVQRHRADEHLPLHHGSKQVVDVGRQLPRRQARKALCCSHVCAMGSRGSSECGSWTVPHPRRTASLGWQVTPLDLGDEWCTGR